MRPQSKRHVPLTSTAAAMHPISHAPVYPDENHPFGAQRLVDCSTVRHIMPLLSRRQPQTSRLAYAPLSRHGKRNIIYDRISPPISFEATPRPWARSTGQPDLGHSVSSRSNKEHLNPSPMFQDHPFDTLSGFCQCSEVKLRIEDSSTSNAPPLALGRSGKAPNAPVRLGDGAAWPHSILLLGAARPCSSAIALGKHTSGTGFLAQSGFQMVTFAHGPIAEVQSHAGRDDVQQSILTLEGIFGTPVRAVAFYAGHPIPWLAQPQVHMANSTSISIPDFEIDECGGYMVIIANAWAACKGKTRVAQHSTTMTHRQYSTHPIVDLHCIHGKTAAKGKQPDLISRLVRLQIIAMTCFPPLPLSRLPTKFRDYAPISVRMDGVGLRSVWVEAIREREWDSRLAWIYSNLFVVVILQLNYLWPTPVARDDDANMEYCTEKQKSALDIIEEIGKSKKEFTTGVATSLGAHAGIRTRVLVCAKPVVDQFDLTRRPRRAPAGW
ncbi:uncharacterized protein CLUP02_11614 [Colletotrichum lupini]|uniref:Uncharacterized protein n=1 Tax=Colletotrichum lupini TaxID=145971 RepID=A0A9Q8SYU7_9PEZI|nr:uncharacterized protein CLUP02_11614 [Colletotrichum lupini]UQC86114.1 hypothetical protein CLUP02_11614 [Colletotrichum lupini]